MTDFPELFKKNILPQTNGKRPCRTGDRGAIEDRILGDREDRNHGDREDRGCSEANSLEQYFTTHHSEVIMANGEDYRNFQFTLLF